MLWPFLLRPLAGFVAGSAKLIGWSFCLALFSALAACGGGSGGAPGISQQAYVKASNTGLDDLFGRSVALSGDGNTLAVGAPFEDSAATGVDGNQADNTAPVAGAVYVLTRSGTTWTQQAYVKASNNTGARDQFGFSVALSGDGNTLAVGAADRDIGAGAVYVFIRSGTTWAQQAYVKASNAGVKDAFGFSVALSGDGNTLAVGAPLEDSAAAGIGGNEADNAADNAGAVYVFARNGATWTQQAYVKASNAEAGDQFGRSVALNGDGNTLAVGATDERSAATGVGGNENDNTGGSAGAAYVFTRSGAVWSQQAYVKASNTGVGDLFGASVTLSGDGNTLAVGAPLEQSAATGIGGNQADNSALEAGAVYVFTRSGTTWTQQAYVKASNTGAADHFGFPVALSGDGNTLAVGALNEDSAAIGIGGNEADNTASSAGAVYVFTRSAATWTQQTYVKASNTGAADSFGNSVALSGDGSTLAVGAWGEASAATGIGGNQADDTLPNAGAVYVFQ